MATTSEGREQWDSRLGFILAAAGSAIGLGNIWRFPVKAGENGGGAFVVIYLACVVFICLPYLFAELALGRKSQQNPVGAIRAIKSSTPWPLVGGLCVLSGFFILSYYAVVAGWTIGYVVKGVFAPAMESKAFFSQLTASPEWVLALFALFLLATVGVVYSGVRRGIERWAKYLVPALFALICMIVFRALTLPGATEGLRFYLTPDFSEVTGFVVVEALGQAFFSLSLGMGAMITYASYLSKEESLVASAGYVVLFDTIIALLSGLMVFPAVLATGQTSVEGPALVFVILPKVFSQVPLGAFVEILFFLLLSIAALTSSISLLEVVISYVVDETRWSRQRGVLLVGGLAFLFGLPAALSQGAVPALSDLSWLIGNRVLGGSPSFFDLMDVLWGSVALALTALLLCLFVGWAWDTQSALDELRRGDDGLLGRFGGPIWSIAVRYVCPAMILIILIFDVLYDFLL
ncbi:MAG: sodium-dependent transporter [Salinibacter sp.]|uniref:sodium-dependent transporter n=1 Tax=Salinibacter sp. TaxID=2065818 RepID=UPI0035D4C74B